jgi:type IV fimbrial biogenesis protein FimT
MMRHKGFTLIELMIVVAVLGVIVTLAAPSMYEFILLQRLKSVNAQLNSDLQFARSEGASRNLPMNVRFEERNGASTCYVIYTGLVGTCNCLRTPVCSASGTEVRTVVHPANLRVRVAPANVLLPSGDLPNIIIFDPNNLSMNVTSADIVIRYPVDFAVETSIDTARTLRTVVTPAGRPTVCGPAGSTLGQTRCP